MNTDVQPQRRVRWGTSHFRSMGDAVTYYRHYGYSVAEVSRMMAEGTIHTGKPVLKPGQKLSLIRDEGRYMIEEVA